MVATTAHNRFQLVLIRSAVFNILVKVKGLRKVLAEEGDESRPSQLSCTGARECGAKNVLMQVGRPGGEKARKREG